MRELICKVCGYVGQSGQTECPECGAPLHVVETAQPVAETAPAEGQEVYITQKKENKKRARQTGSKARSVRWAACFLTLCLVLQGAGLWLLGRGDGMFLRTGENWWIFYNDFLVTPSGLFPLTRTAFPQGFGIGGRAVIVDHGAFLYGGTYSDRDVSTTTYYYYDGQTIQPTDWENGYLNGDGTVLFFTRREGEDYALYRRDLERDRTEELLRTQTLPVLDAMAQDGSAIRCYTWEAAGEGGDERRWLWSRRTGTVFEGTETDMERREYIMKLGRNGDNRLTCRFNEPGPNIMEEVTQVVDWGRRGTETELSDRWRAYITDRDLTQILYRDGEGRWRYEDERGKTGELAGLEKVEGLEALTPDTRGAWLGMARLTPWVYRGSDDHLYRIDDDLRVTDLTPEGEVEHAFIHPEGKELYYATRVDGTFRIQRPLKKNWRAVQISEKPLMDLTVATDLSVCAAKASAEGTVGVVVIVDGEETALEHASNTGWVHCLNDGCCWYEGKGHELWFWSRETGEQKVMGPGGSTTVIDADDGDQAVLCLTSYSNPVGEERSYWLLDNKGNATRLEVREDGIAGAADGSDGYHWNSAGYGSGGRLSPAAIPLT